MALLLWHLSEFYSRYTMDHAIVVSYRKIAMISPPFIAYILQLVSENVNVIL